MPQGCLEAFFVLNSFESRPELIWMGWRVLVAMFGAQMRWEFGRSRVLSWFFGERFNLGADFDRMLSFEFRERLVPLSVVLAGLYSLLAVCHPIFVPDPAISNLLMLSAASSSMVCVGVAVYVSWRRPKNHWVHALGLLLTLLMLGNSGLHRL